MGSGCHSNAVLNSALHWGRKWGRKLSFFFPVCDKQAHSHPLLWWEIPSVMLRAEWCKQLWAATSVTDSMGAEFDFWDMFWLANNLGNTENSISSTQEKFLNRHLVALSPHHCVPVSNSNRLWIWVCILLTNGVDARVVTSFAQGLCAQEYLIKLFLVTLLPGQHCVLLHTRGPGETWWVRGSQSERWWKRSLPPASADFFPLAASRAVLQL